MTERIHFQFVEIEGFRGFGEPERLELGASAVIVIGANGTGKTSFFDALQWLVLGRLPRLEAYASRRSEDFVVNRWSKSRTAIVTAELRIGDRKVYVRRSGTREASHLELHDQNGDSRGDAAQQQLAALFLLREGISLREAIASSGLLQQDDLRAVIEDDPNERYAHLTRLLGLGSLPDFATTARSRADALAKEAKQRGMELSRLEAQAQEAQAELQHLMAQVAEAPGIQGLLRDLTETLGSQGSALNIVGGFPLDPDELSRLGTAARRIRERAAHLVADGQRLAEEMASQREVPPGQLELAAERVERLSDDLGGAEAAVQVAKESIENAERLSNRFADLAVRALPLLGERCPVCQQPIDAEHVNERLRSLLAQEDRGLLTLRGSVDNGTVRRDALEQEWQEATRHHDDLLAQKARFDRYYEARRDWAAACANLVDGIGSLRPVNVHGVKEGNEAALDAVRRSAVEVERATREAAAALLAPELGGKIENQRAHVGQLTVEVERRREAVAAANRRANEARVLSHATADAITNVTRRRFEMLAPLVAEIYSRLDPHPAFTGLDYALDVYRRRPVADPVVIDEERGITADPLLVFSSSQTNVAALTFFLAMSWTAGSHALPFLLLDDPLQAMDDINALGFADLCRHIRGARQLVVSTHDRRLGNLLVRKLAPRTVDEQTRVLRFVGWDRSGPQVEQELVEPQLEAAGRRVLMEAA